MPELLQKLNTFNTTEISDALDSCGMEGALLNIKPLNSGIKLIGPAYTIQYAANETPPMTFQNAANYIDNVPEKSVILIDNNGREDCTVWGEILTQMAVKKNISGTVINGAVRDVEFIRTAKYPLYSKAITMRSGKNRVHKINEQCSLTINGVIINPGDIIFADEHGVLVIPKHLLNEIINKAAAIQLTEKQIKIAIEMGMSLEEARNKYRYDQPWLSGENDAC